MLARAHPGVALAHKAAGGSGNQLGTDERGVRQVLSEEETGAILLGNYRVPAQGATAADRLHCERGIRSVPRSFALQ